VKPAKKPELSCDIRGLIDTIKYSYVAKWRLRQPAFSRFVTFFLSRFTGGDPSQHDHEVDRVEWFTVTDAIDRATYPQERESCAKPRHFIRKEAS